MLLLEEVHHLLRALRAIGSPPPAHLEVGAVDLACVGGLAARGPAAGEPTGIEHRQDGDTRGQAQSAPRESSARERRPTSLPHVAVRSLRDRPAELVTHGERGGPVACGPVPGLRALPPRALARRGRSDPSLALYRIPPLSSRCVKAACEMRKKGNVRQRKTGRAMRSSPG